MLHVVFNTDHGGRHCLRAPVALAWGVFDDGDGDGPLLASTWIAAAAVCCSACRTVP